MTEDLKVLPKEKLAVLITETEATLNDLKAEMEQRDDAARGHEIDRLDEHLKNAELSLQTIRDFVRYLVDDFRSK